MARRTSPAAQRDAIAAAIGRRIRAAREEQHWTLQDLQRESGIDYRQIERWENGYNEPRITTVLVLAKALRKSPEYIAFGDSAAPDQLSDREQTVIQTFRVLPVHLQAAVMNVCDYANDRGRTVKV